MFKAFVFCIPTRGVKVPAGRNGFTKSGMTAIAFASSAMGVVFG
jgi:hypothetical protein